MKRVLAILVLTVAGLLTFSMLMAPEAVLASEQEELSAESTDARGDTQLVTCGEPDDDKGGDPDSLTGGFGVDDSMDTLQDLGAGNISDGIRRVEDLIAYLSMMYWAL